MRENVLHYLWKFKKLKSLAFKSVDRQSIEILHPGYHNTNAGPDFLNAKIKVNGLEWNGHVEIHVKSSEWDKHRHQFDPAYNNVVLHIVYTCDQPVFNHAGAELVQAEICDLVYDDDLHEAEQFLVNPATLACAGQISNVEKVIVRNQLERSFYQRLEQKYGLIVYDLQRTKGNWEETTYRVLARAFGTNINKHPFEQLSEYVPLTILLKEAYSAKRIEALLFYISGLCNGRTDGYAMELAAVGKPIAEKYKLPIMQGSVWKFATMRPPNFPTLRLSQLAELLFRVRNIFSRIIESETTTELLELFQCRTLPYWESHYTFGMQSPDRGVRKATQPFIEGLIVNAALPLLFAYGKHTHNTQLIERCTDIAHHLSPEKNNITGLFEKAGLRIHTAFESQALLGLKNDWCTPKKCLSCSIGSKLVNRHEKSSVGV